MDRSKATLKRLVTILGYEDRPACCKQLTRNEIKRRLEGRVCKYPK
ncbi:hypothetical protein [Parageobacillus thermoglucosidasius]|nr:hypothetical protein [Parageobacillus thermoglucosidasius]AEH49198.1 hypothetical protein Geoth_3334 [Parageobacillus thermoglucosidasius C56-YS93]GCD84007.1 hypothetical protein PTHTG4_30720 [Parageobacillus thermoglucosidasius]